MNRRSVLSLAGAAAIGAAAPAMAQTPTASNADIAKAFVEKVLNANNVNALDALTDPAIGPSSPGDAPGINAYKARVTGFLQDSVHNVAGVKFTTESLVSQNDQVVVRGFVTGASRSGKAVNATYFVQLSIKNGKIAGSWIAYDSKAILGY